MQHSAPQLLVTTCISGTSSHPWRRRQAKVSSAFRKEFACWIWHDRETQPTIDENWKLLQTILSKWKPDAVHRNFGSIATRARDTELLADIQRVRTPEIRPGADDVSYPDAVRFYGRGRGAAKLATTCIEIGLHYLTPVRP